MEKTEGYYLNKKIVQNSELTGNEKLILSILIQYWKNTKYKKKECIDTVSFTFLKNMTGIKNVHTITKAIENFIKKGFLVILNKEDLKYRHHIPKIILKEENINVFFNTDIFNNTGKKQNNPPGTGLSSTPSYKKKESGEAVKKEGAAPPSRQAQLSFIKQNHDNYNNFKQTKQERNGIQEERRNSYAKELAYFWDEL